MKIYKHNDLDNSTLSDSEIDQVYESCKAIANDAKLQKLTGFGQNCFHTDSTIRTVEGKYFKMEVFCILSSTSDPTVYVRELKEISALEWAEINDRFQNTKKNIVNPSYN